MTVIKNNSANSDHPSQPNPHTDDLAARADRLAALVAVAGTTPTGVDHSPSPEAIVAVLGEVLEIADQIAKRVARNQDEAADLAQALMRIAVRLDQWLAQSGLETIEGRSVADLRSALDALMPR